MDIEKVEVMNFVYILQSKETRRYYIGSTNNLERRLQEHNFGKTKSLKYLRPMILAFSKSFQTMHEAKKMKLKLKKMKSKNIIEQIIKEGEIQMGL